MCSNCHYVIIINVMNHYVNYDTHDIVGVEYGDLQFMLPAYLFKPLLMQPHWTVQHAWRIKLTTNFVTANRQLVASITPTDGGERVCVCM